MSTPSEYAPPSSHSNNFRDFTGSSSLKSDRRALIIAVEYKGQQWENHYPMDLYGCHADAKDVVELLCEENYKPRYIRVLVDIPSLEHSQQPTRDNIMKGIRWLVEGCRGGDRRFISFAGHGCQVDDQNGDEEDHKDEAIIPSDWARTHKEEVLIIDDALRSELVDKMPKGSVLTALFDCCHSGTILDLDNEVEPQVIGKCKFDRQKRPATPEAKVKPANRTQVASIKSKVICWSACTDCQNAYGTCDGRRGRMTVAFTKSMRRLGAKNYARLGEAIFKSINHKLPVHQDPQLWMSTMAKPKGRKLREIQVVI